MSLDRLSPFQRGVLKGAWQGAVTGAILGSALFLITGCAAFEALFGPAADPGLQQDTQMTLMALIGPPFNLAVPAVFGILTALFAPKEPQL